MIGRAGKFITKKFSVRLTGSAVNVRSRSSHKETYNQESHTFRSTDRAQDLSDSRLEVTICDLKFE